jgi:hypothetical protein
MSQIVDLTLNAKTFEAHTPQLDSTPAAWYEKSAGQLNGYQKTTQATTIVPASNTSKVRSTFYHPVLDTDGNVSHYSTAVIQVVKSEKSTTAEKTDLLEQIRSYVLTSEFSDAVLSDETVY